MNDKKSSMPPPDADGNAGTAAPKPRSSFVRIPRKKGASKPRPAQAVEAELVDDEDVPEELRDGGEKVESLVPFGGEEAEVEVLPPEFAEEVEVSDEELDTELEKESAGLVAVSALQRYLTEIRKFSLMTPEEERKVATKAFEEKDLNARNRLVTANLRLVVKIAMEYRRAYAQILDLIQEGNAGLVQAVNRFNPYRGVKLSTYSAWWIRAYILKFLMDNKSLVRMGTTDAQRKLFFRLRSEAEKMYALTQRFDAKLLAENIGVREQDVVEMQQRLSKGDVSLDAPTGTEGDQRPVDALASDLEAADVKLERDQLLGVLRREMKAVEAMLNERDIYIFRNRIIADDPITLQDVGDKFGITRERARQLETKILQKIRARLQDAGLEDA